MCPHTAKARAAEIRAQVLAMIQAAPDGLKREQIQKALGLSFNGTVTATKALQNEGLIELTELGTHGVWATPERCAAIRARQAAERLAHARQYQAMQDEIQRKKRAAARLERLRKQAEQKAAEQKRVNRAPPLHAVRIKAPPPAPMSIFNLARLTHESTPCTTP